MHIPVALGGLRTQILEGYIFSKMSNVILFTTDNKSALAQLSILDEKEIAEDENGNSIVQIMCGSYNGASKNVRSKLFTTGILLMRDDFEKRDSFKGFYNKPLQEWKLADIEGFGLVKRKDIPDAYLNYLFQYYPEPDFGNRSRY